MSNATLGADVHPNSKIVTVFRAVSFLERGQKGIDDFFAMSKQSIGSYFESVNSKAIGSGLTIAEQDLLLPYVLDIPTEDKEFRKNVTKFYGDLMTPIPYKTGRALEVGLTEDNALPVSKANLPLNIMDYIRYRHILRHPQVAATKEGATGNQIKTYYISDPETEFKRLDTQLQSKDEALELYLLLKNDPARVDALLTVLDVNPITYTGKNKAADKIAVLRGFVDSKPQEFLKAYKVDHFETRYIVKSLVNARILTKTADHYLESDTRRTLANSTDEMVLFIEDPANSAEVNFFKVKLREYLKGQLAVEKEDKPLIPKAKPAK